MNARQKREARRATIQNANDLRRSLRADQAAELSAALSEVLPKHRVTTVRIKLPSELTGQEYEVAMGMKDGYHVVTLHGWGESPHAAMMDAARNGYQPRLFPGEEEDLPF